MNLFARARALLTARRQAPKQPCLRDLSQTVIMSAEQLNSEMQALSQCDCVEAVAKVMTRAQRQKAGG